MRSVWARISGKGRATPLFASAAVQFDVAPDHHFVLTEPNTAPPASPLHLVFDWFEELKRKCQRAGRSRQPAAPLQRGALHGEARADVHAALERNR